MIVLILAGGLGKRMNSSKPKVIHDVNLKPMIVHVIEKALKLTPKKIYIIVGKYKNIIQETINEYISETSIIDYIIQHEPNGTGHAIMCCVNELKQYENQSVLILSGDVPFISFETLLKLLEKQNNILIANVDDPFGCGRIILKNNKISNVVEQKDCSDEEQKIKIINCGIYNLELNIILKYINRITNNNKANEYYLPDIIPLLINDNIDINYYNLENINEIVNVNSQNDLFNVNQYMIRNIESNDYFLGYIQLMNQLTTVGNITYEDFDTFVNNLSKNHIVYVIEDIKNKKIIGTGTCFIEPKIIHNCKSVGHIEDVVISNDVRNLGFGKLLIQKLTKYSFDNNCYKVILNCDEKNITFYEKCGFKKREIEMVKYF